jgi:hypothetical protein
MRTGDLPGAWRRRAEELAPYAPGAATAWARAAAELEAAEREGANEVLSLADAARESGYSHRRLRELMADGTVPNVGRKYSPAIRRADLPKRPRRSGPAAYDPDADAQRLRAA